MRFKLLLVENFTVFFLPLLVQMLQQFDERVEHIQFSTSLLPLSRGIVAFEIDVSEWQAKKKISQNKTTHEQERIADSLSKSPHTHEQLIGEYMQKNQTK